MAGKLCKSQMESKAHKQREVFNIEASLKVHNQTLYYEIYEVKNKQNIKSAAQIAVIVKKGGIIIFHVLNAVNYCLTCLIAQKLCYGIALIPDK